MQRVEVVVAARDAGLIEAAAGILRKNGPEAMRMREALLSMTSAPPPAKTGAELVAFLRASPFAGEDLAFERDRSAGRPVGTKTRRS